MRAIGLFLLSWCVALLAASCGGGSSADGDMAVDGDTVGDGDTSVDGDSTVDGDTAADGDIPGDGDTIVDGDQPGELEYEAIDELLGAAVDETWPVVGLAAPAGVAWGAYGIPHLFAASDRDAMVALGWVAADRRMFEMEFFRKAARGRLTELLGGIDPIIESSLYYRMLFSKRDGSDLLAAIEAAFSTEERDLMQAFADGVNARLDRYRRDPSDWPDQLGRLYLPQSPAQTDPWEIADTLAIVRLQEWDLAGSLENELKWTAMLGALGPDLFGQIAFAGPGVELEIMPSETRTAAGTGPRRAVRPSERLLDQVGRAQAWLARARSVMPDDRGQSNNWAARLPGGLSILSNDPHLSLTAAPIFLPVTLDTRALSPGGGGLQLAGVAFPGIPAVIIGRNDRVAWAETNAGYDVTDIYQEQVVYNGDGEPVSVLFQGSQVPVVKVVQRFRNGHLPGARHIERPLYFVPHHGPIIPSTIDPASGTALSFRWTGHEVTNEMRGVLGLQRATTVEQAMQALSAFDVGIQNFTLVDTEGSIGWYPHGWVPIRGGDLAASPPWMVMPGHTGQYEWTGRIADDDLPRAYNPERGWIVTANNDPTGHTFDDDPLNDPFYYMFDPDPGFRAQAATLGVQELLSAGTTDWQAWAALTHQQIDLHARRLSGLLIRLVDLHDLTGSLTANGQAAVGLLRDWDGSMPSGLADEDDPAGSPPVADPAVRRNAAAASYFHCLLVRLNHDILMDELAAAGVTGLGWQHSLKAVLRIVTRYIENDQVSPLFDDVSTPGNEETPDQIVLLAIERAVDDLFARPEFATIADLSEAYWGRIHTLTMKSRVSSITDAYDAGPFAAGGSVNTINRASFGIGIDPARQSYAYTNGPSMRMVHEVTAAGITTHFNLPGGVDERAGSPHFLDLYQIYRRGEMMTLSPVWDEIRAAGYGRLTALAPARAVR